MKLRIAMAGLVAALLVALAVTHEMLDRSAGAAPAVAPSDASYPYRGETFTSFVTESYKVAGKGEPEEFYRWFEDAYASSAVRYPGQERLPLPDLLDWKRGQLAAIKDPAQRSKEQVAFCEWMHKAVKKNIPRFSLDRGFEFFNTVRYGERQCYLQAVLIAGMLQRTGVDAGIAMVYRNIEGGYSNNGHCATLVRFPDGKSVIVDASDPIPFVRQTGLFARTGSYLYVEPVYEGATPFITGYRATGSGRRLKTAEVRTLDLSFIHSQFFYYRGERVPGGLLAKTKSPAALKQAADYLKTSVRFCPQNPLAVYMLGRAELELGQKAQAARQFSDAGRLYRQFGWVPDGLKPYLAKK